METMSKGAQGHSLIKRIYWKLRGKYRRIIKDRFLYRTIPTLYERCSKAPVDENKVIFIERRYDTLQDSLALLYQRLKETYDFDVHVHCLNYRETIDTGYRKRSIRMMQDFATAKYVFLSDASEVISAVDKRPETVVLDTWHGCGAFKRFGLSTGDLIFGASTAAMQRHPNYRGFDYVTVSSPEVIWAYAEAMGLKEDVIRPVGISRTDIFYDAEAIAAAKAHLDEIFPASKGKKVVLYAPTFRGRVARAKSPDRLDMKAFVQALGQEYALIVKHHPLVKQPPAVPEELKGQFIFDATRQMTIEELLMVSDICISDYSSLIFEFSLFERPMLFFAYDLEDYFDWRGFYYPYEEMTPGPICRTTEELIQQILYLKEHFDKKQVQAFREKFMSACDGHATERILELVMGKETLRNHRKD